MCKFCLFEINHTWNVLFVDEEIATFPRSLFSYKIRDPDNVNKYTRKFPKVRHPCAYLFLSTNETKGQRNIIGWKVGRSCFHLVHENFVSWRYFELTEDKVRRVL